MAEIVFVHGIDQQQMTADALENKLWPFLAGGVRIAGFADIADRIWRERNGPGGISARVAFYGDMFLRRGTMGAGAPDIPREEAGFAEALALEWLTNVAERAPDPYERKLGKIELEYVTQKNKRTEMGAGAVVRSAISSLSKLDWFAPIGMAFAERCVKRALAQVTLYFSNEEIRRKTLAVVLKLVGPETKVLIGHSLGSVIAYEAAFLAEDRMRHPLPLLMTLGSPLGLNSIVYQRVRPQPPVFPANVQRWVNVAALDDYIAVEPDIRELFSAGMPSNAVFEYHTVDNGAMAHDGGFYLGKAAVGKPIGEALSRASVGA